MAFIYRGCRWTIFDIVWAIAVVVVFGYFAIKEVGKLGISLASVAGAVWLTGILLFLFLYPLPMFGRSLEGERIAEEAKKEGRALTKEEFEIFWGRGFHSKISTKVLKLSSYSSQSRAG